MRLSTFTGALVGLSLLTGCSILPEAKPIDYYVMKPMPVASQGPAVRSANRVATPELGDALQLERIVRINSAGGVMAYPNAKWSSSIATLWQNWLLEGLWRDARFEHISSAQQGLDNQWQLAGRLQALQVEETAQGAVAVVRFDAQLIDTRQRRLHASHRFSAQVPVAANTTAAAVQALQAASAEVGQQLLDWLAATP